MSANNTAAEVLAAATGQNTEKLSLQWLANDHRLLSGSDIQAVLEAVVELGGEDEISKRALRRVTKDASFSAVDTSKVLFSPESIPGPADIREALLVLRQCSPTGSLSSLTPTTVLSAQAIHPMALEVLCLICGVSYSEANQWFNSDSRDWTRQEVEELLTYLKSLVDGSAETLVAGAIPAKAVELLSGAGWAEVDSFIENGVPYEYLVTQRLVGGAWLAHKNKTSGLLNTVSAKAVCAGLKSAGISYRLATTVGGDAKQKDLQELTGIKDKRISLVILKATTPRLVVAFSSAKDGGTARANGDGLLQIPLGNLRGALFLTGLGWSSRPETDRLAKHFEGRLFTERTLGALIELCRDLVA